MSDRYDVMLFGVSDEGDRGQILRHLASILKVDEGVIARASSGQGVVLRSGLGKEVAERYRDALIKAGAVCNLRPAKENSGIQLELVPLDQSGPDQERAVFLCPACGFRQESAGSERPLMCPSCGVVPEKFSRLQAEKTERERIKQQLLRQHHLQQEKREAEEAHRKQAALRRELEEEIRRELSLPWALSTRAHRIGTSAVLWGTGLLMGLGVSILYVKLNAPPAPLPYDGKNAAISSSMSTLIESLSSGQEARLRLAADYRSSTRPAMGTATGRWSRVSEGARTAAKTLSVDHAPVNAAQLWETRRPDPTWDRLLELENQRLLATDQAQPAFKVVLGITEPMARWQAMLDVAVHEHHAGHPAERDQLMAAVEEQLDGFGDPSLAVAGLGFLAEALAAVGESAHAQAISQKLGERVATLRVAGDKAAALGYQAAYLQRSGQVTQAEESWREANVLVARQQDVPAQVAAYIRLAESYALIQDYATATGLLTDLVPAVGRLPRDERRFQLERQVVRGLCRTGGLEAALQAANDWRSEMDRDALVFDIVSELLGLGDPYQALKAAEALRVPFYKCRTGAAIAWSLKADKQQNQFARETYSQAAARLMDIVSPTELAISKAELSRYQALLEDPSSAADFSTQAIQAAGLVTPSSDKDMVWANLTNQFARGGLLPEARRVASFISDGSTAREATLEVTDVSAVYSAINH